MLNNNQVYVLILFFLFAHKLLLFANYFPHRQLCHSDDQREEESLFNFWT